MAVLPYILDASAENFPRLVLENSRRGPVAVNFWSPRAGPCLVLMPRLIRVVSEYGGRLLLVMLNTDDHAQLATRLGVRALPLVQVFRDGNVIDSLQGVQSEPDLRAFLTRQLPRPDAAVLHARRTADPAEAARLAAQEALEHPEDPDAALRVARFLVLDKRPIEAFSLLDTLPAALRTHGEIAALHAHLALVAAMTQETGPAAASEAARLFYEAAGALARDEYEIAYTRLLACATADPGYREGLAQRAAEALLALPLSPEVRARLAAAAAAPP